MRKRLNLPTSFYFLSFILILETSSLFIFFVHLRLLFLVLSERPSFVSPLPERLQFPRFQPAHILCNVSGSSPLNVRWITENGELVTNTRAAVWRDGQELVFLHMLPNNGGRYTCIANNPFGNVNTSVHVIVEGETQWLFRSNVASSKVITLG